MPTPEPAPVEAGDGLQRLIRETDQGTAQVNTTLDAQGNTTTYTDPRTLATTYLRNGFGDVNRRTSPDRGITDTVFDLRGLGTQMTDARGIVTNFTYDNAGRMLTKSFPAASAENVTYTYDSVLAGNKGKGRLTSVTDESGSTAYVFDARGNVLTETHVIAGQSYAVGYAYDLADRVSTITYPSGRIVTYVRDAQGRVTSVTTKQNTTSAVVTLASGIAWQPFSGLVSSMSYGNGLTETDTYSLDYEINRLLVQNGAASVQDNVCTRTDKLNITGITDAVTPANNQTFAYSPANRLSSAAGNYGTFGWTYDGVGNRTGQTLGGVTAPYAYPTTSNRLSTIGGTARTFTYDAAGNVATDTRAGVVNAYTYNNANRLKTVTVAANLKATYTAACPGEGRGRRPAPRHPRADQHDPVRHHPHRLRPRRQFAHGEQWRRHGHHARIRLAARNADRTDHGFASRRPAPGCGRRRRQHSHPRNMVRQHRPPQPPRPHDRRFEGHGLASHLEALRRAAGDHGIGDARRPLPRPVVPARIRLAPELVAAL